MTDLKTHQSQTRLHKEDRLFFVKGMLMAPLVPAGVSDDDAQELHVPIGPQALGGVEETMSSRPATLKRSRHSGSDRAGSAQLDALSGSALVQRKLYVSS